MSLHRQLVFWLGFVLVLVALLYAFRGILLPFVAGMALAYLLNPVADRLQRLGLPRIVATTLILGVFVLALVVAVVLLAPVISRQLVALAQDLPGYAQALRRLLMERMPGLAGRLEGGADLDASLGDLVGQGAGWVGAVVARLWTGGAAFVSTLSLLVITPVVAFYLLVDWDRMMSEADRWLPRRHAATIRRLAAEIHAAVAGFVRGQVVVCLILGTFYAVGLTAVGLKFGLVIGLGAGFLSFIPYVGTISGFVTAMGVALFQFWPDWTWILATLAVFLLGQLLEGNVLQPKLIGRLVGLHPVWLMFALLAFGTLFGFVGLLLAVPLAASLGVLARFALRRYMASPLYTGEEAEASEPLPPPEGSSRPDRVRAGFVE